MWLSEQYGRGFKPMFRRLYHWLTTGDLPLDELTLWCELMRLFGNHPIPIERQTNLTYKFRLMWDHEAPPDEVRAVLQGLISIAGSAEHAIDAVRETDDVMNLLQYQ